MEFIKRDCWIDVINNGKVNSIAIYNKSLSYDLVIEQLKELYKIKQDIENVLKAMINKYKVKGIINVDDVNHLQSITSNWIQDNRVNTAVKNIIKWSKESNHTYTETLVESLYYYIKNSEIKMTMNDYYLFESY